MKCLWVSPEGNGQPIAEALVHQGHTVVSWGPNAIPGVNAVDRHALAPFAQAADLVVVDGPFPLTQTRRSWRPSNESLFFDELRRHYRVIALGPTPTIDLMVGDARYLRKICGRFAIPYGAGDGEPWSSGAWFFGAHVIPEGPYLKALAPLFRSVGFRGWLELCGVVTDDGPTVQTCNASWPLDVIPDNTEARWLETMAV